MNFDQEFFNEFETSHKVIRFGDRILSCGRKTKWYVNWRNILEDVYLKDSVVNFIIDFTKGLGLEPDTFYGVPEGATKLGLFTQDKWAKQSLVYGPKSHVLAMGRGKPKDHGDEKDRYFLGIPKGKTIILEDVTTTGSSLIDEIEKLQNENVNVIAAFGLTHRMEKRDDGLIVKEAVKIETNTDYYALSYANELLPLAYKTQKPGREIAKAIEEEFEKYGEVKLKLL